MTSPHEPIVPSKEFQGKSGIAPIADFVMETDWSAGQVIKPSMTRASPTIRSSSSRRTTGTRTILAGKNWLMPDICRVALTAVTKAMSGRAAIVCPWSFAGPKRIKAGTSSKQMVCLTDVFATCAGGRGGVLPPEGAEDSISFLPTLIGKSGGKGRTTLVNHSNHGEFAYRNGPWKLVFKMSGRQP